MARKDDEKKPPTEIVPSDLEQAAGTADILQRLPPDLVLMKMENESIMAMAASRPRNHKKILAELKEQLDAYPTFAAGAIYEKPVGKDDSGQMKTVRNLSIRAAESIREAYGFNRVSTTAEPIHGEDDRLRLTATFVDYQKGMVWSDTVIITPWYKSRGGSMVKMPEDRYLNVEVPRRRSILVREVILRSVPAGLKSELFELADRAMEEGLDDKTITRLVAEFGAMGVHLDALEAFAGHTTANWTKTDKKKLLGVWQAIQDNETTVAEAFGITVGSIPPKKVRDIVAADVTLADVMPPAKKVEPAPGIVGPAALEHVNPTPAEPQDITPPWAGDVTGAEMVWAAASTLGLKKLTKDPTTQKVAYAVAVPTEIVGQMTKYDIVLTPDDHLLPGMNQEKQNRTAANMLWSWHLSKLGS